MRISSTFRWRPMRILALIFFAINICFGYFYLKYRPPYSFYEALKDDEVYASKNHLKNLHTHKYVFFKQLEGAGFNNQVQEILLFHHLALLTGRVYVYQPFWWQPRRTFLPLSAFLLGPTNGSISSVVYDEICPASEVKHVSIPGPFRELWNNAQQILNGPERCLTVDNRILSWSYLASPFLHDIFPLYRKYLLDHFQWPQHILDMTLRARSKLQLTDDNPYMAIHFRRGDFEEHCQLIATDNIGMTTWNTLPSLQHSIFPPSLDPFNASSVIEHCYPTLYRILNIIDLHARGRPDVRSVYFLHDGAWDHPLVYHQFYKLEAALKSSKRAKEVGWIGGMNSITHSGILPVRRGERDWKVAVDVELARRADVFIGNGYSSLSAQIAALRLADGGVPHDISFY